MLGFSSSWRPLWCVYNDTGAASVGAGRARWWQAGSEASLHRKTRHGWFVTQSNDAWVGCSSVHC